MPKEAITRPINTGILLTGIILAVGETDNEVYIFNDMFKKKILLTSFKPRPKKQLITEKKSFGGREIFSIAHWYEH